MHALGRAVVLACLHACMPVFGDVPPSIIMWAVLCHAVVVGDDAVMPAHSCVTTYVQAYVCVSGTQSMYLNGIAPACSSQQAAAVMAVPRVLKSG